MFLIASVPMAYDPQIADAPARIDALIREMREVGQDMSAHLLEMAKLELIESAKNAPRV